MTMQSKIALYVAWIQAFVGMVGSLYFSEVANFAPCLLCWYQRICMYPLVILFAVGLLRRDNGVVYYAMPLTLIGLVISVYHNLLYWNVIPHALEPCRIGVSCTTKYIEWFGFITIPFLSFLGFALITFCLLVVIRNQKRHVE